MMEHFGELARLPTRTRVTLGARAGERLGAYLGLLTFVIGALSRRASPDALAAVALAAAVFVGVVAGGVIFGVARPYVRDAYGAALLGAACVAPVFLAAAAAARGVRPVHWRPLLALGALSVVLGGMLGTMAWRGWTRQPRS